MSSLLHVPGPTHLLIRQRRRLQTEPFYYLGTAVTAPEIVSEKIKSPVTTDLLGPVPINSIYHSEIHTVTAVLNVFDYSVYNRLRARYDPADFGLRRGDLVEWVGNLMVPVEDFELLLLYDPPHGSPLTHGRLYVSALPLRFRESTENNRVFELGVVIECTPLLVNLAPILVPPNSEPETMTMTNSRSSNGSRLPPSIDIANVIISIGASVINGVNKVSNVELTTKSTLKTTNTLASTLLKGGQLQAETVAPNSPIPATRKGLFLYTEFPADWVN